jgi:RNA polymerase sigma-70 factor (ECF subfamily)
MANDADTDDATQEALLAICRGIGRFDGRSSFGTWIYRVTTNACLDELRRKSRRPIAMDADTMPAKTVPDGFAGDIADRLEIDAALAQLSPEFRAAVVLRDLCQLDYDEIAEVLAIPPGTVRSRIARGPGAARSLRRRGEPGNCPRSSKAVGMNDFDPSLDEIVSAFVDGVATARRARPRRIRPRARRTGRDLPSPARRRRVATRSGGR